MCHCHRDLEQVFRGGESTLPSPLLMRTSMPLVPGPTVCEKSPGKSVPTVLHTSACLQPLEEPRETTYRNIPSLPWQAMRTAKSVVQMPA